MASKGNDTSAPPNPNSSASATAATTITASTPCHKAVTTDKIHSTAAASMKKHLIPKAEELVVSPGHEEDVDGTITASEDDMAMPADHAEPEQRNLEPPSLGKKPSSSAEFFIDQDFQVSVNGLYFQNIQESKSATEQIQWHAPANDITIPQTDKDAHRIVKQLRDALMDISEAQDSKNSGYRMRFEGGTTRMSYHSWHAEAAAWGIYDLCMKTHTRGFNCPIIDREIISGSFQTQNWTFQERVDEICRAFLASKALAVHCIKHEKLMTIVAVPHRLIQGSRANHVSNNRRANWIKEGRAADPEYKPRPSSTNKRQKTAQGAAKAKDTSQPDTSTNQPLKAAQQFTGSAIAKPASIAAAAPSNPSSIILPPSMPSWLSGWNQDTIARYSSRPLPSLPVSLQAADYPPLPVFTEDVPSTALLSSQHPVWGSSGNTAHTVPGSHTQQTSTSSVETSGLNQSPHVTADRVRWGARHFVEQRRAQDNTGHVQPTQEPARTSPAVLNTSVVVTRDAGTVGGNRLDNNHVTNNPNNGVDVGHSQAPRLRSEAEMEAAEALAILSQQKS